MFDTWFYLDGTSIDQVGCSGHFYIKNVYDLFIMNTVIENNECSDGTII